MVTGFVAPSIMKHILDGAGVEDSFSPEIELL
jgi:ribosomal protein S5